MATATQADLFLVGQFQPRGISTIGGICDLPASPEDPIKIDEIRRDLRVAGIQAAGVVGQILTPLTRPAELRYGAHEGCPKTRGRIETTRYLRRPIAALTLSAGPEV